MTPDAGRVFRELGDTLFRYLVRMCGSPDLAGDVLQDTFVRLVERPPSRRDNLRGWLFRVATNRLRDLERKRGRRARLAQEAGGRRTMSDPPASPGRIAAAREARERARRVLDRLPDRDRALLLMREEGFTHREMAEAVGTTTGSVGTMIARALDRFAQELELLEGRQG